MNSFYVFYLKTYVFLDYRYVYFQNTCVKLMFWVIMVVMKEKVREKPKKIQNNSTKKWKIMLGAGCGMLVVGVIMTLVAFLAIKTQTETLDFALLSKEESSEIEYSALTGLELAEGEKKDAPAYCVQTPNGLDGARPQAGLNQAGVIFEAVAEAGITRFAAIYQDPSSAVIGPIRSLRTYYLEWDTPFDCTIVHAGGSGDALAAVANGYKDLTENYTYMYRGSYGGRLWNNLFTTADLLKKASADAGNSTSEIKGFSRMTPEESGKALAETSAVEKLVITEPAEGDTSAVAISTPAVAIRFGGLANYNVNYAYDEATNTYLRSYESGAPHEIYTCPEEDLGEVNPEDYCNLTQMAPSVVVAMIVDESKAADNYHEDITTVGSGEAYIFQNGTAIQGKWNKSTVKDQIKFTDENGEEVKLAPGQTIVSAVPKYGSVEF